MKVKFCKKMLYINFASIFFLLFVMLPTLSFANPSTELTLREKLIGIPSSELRLSLGLWSYHARGDDRNGKNDLFGFSEDGFFLGTLRNSFDQRAYAGGIQRYWLTGSLSEKIDYEFGYRFGLVTGYKGHSIISRSTKNYSVLPFAQLVLGLKWQRIGWEISTPNPYVISTGFYIVLS